MRERPFEIVERKGFGHPDTICDSLANHLAERLKNAYLSDYGGPHHYNLDKALLSAGAVHIGWGGGHVIKPITLYVGDRASPLKSLKLSDFFEEGAKGWVKDNLRLEPEYLNVIDVTQEGSGHLKSLFDGQSYSANDTSATVGYAPLSPTERLVLDLDDLLQGSNIPAVGQDVKIMAVRMNKNINITLAIAMVAKHCNNRVDYDESVAGAHEQVNGFLVDNYPLFKTSVTINALDHPKSIDSKDVYLTRSGLCVESADSGQVGRGNNPLGVIPLNRPVGAEAEAGKNDICHVGKIYTNMGYDIAQDLHEAGLGEAYVWMVSRIGNPITEPITIIVQTTEPPEEEVINDIINRHLDALSSEGKPS